MKRVRVFVYGENKQLGTEGRKLSQGFYYVFPQKFNSDSIRKRIRRGIFLFRQKFGDHV